MIYNINVFIRAGLLVITFLHGVKNNTESYIRTFDTKISEKSEPYSKMPGPID